MSDYWFFLSYSRTDDDIYLQQFVTDLGDEIRRLAGLASNVSAEDVGFFDQRSIEVGDTWDRTLVDALQNSRMMLCLYSRGYFNSEWCGIELQVFRSRVEEFVKSSSERIDPPPLIIPVLWRPPHLVSRHMPKPLANLNIQYTHADLGEVYANKGLRTLVALGSVPASSPSSLYKADYMEFLENIAGKIVEEAEHNRLRPLDNLPPLRETKSIFIDPPVASTALATTNDTPTQDNVGPGTAQFVYVAGRSNELQEVRPGARCYGSTGGHEWRPWDPPVGRAVGILAAEVVSSQDIFYKDLPVDNELVDRLRKAEDDNTMVIMVVDPWSVKVPAYRDKMLEYDRNHDRNLFDNCAVLVAWNEAEQATGLGKQDLSDNIQDIFRHSSSKTTYFRFPIASADEFEREVSSAIYEIRRKLMRKAQFDRPVPSGEALQAIHGPGAAS